jgi:hypothetical protein
MAFTSVKPISQNVIANIEEQIGEVSIIPGQDLDLKGVTIDKAYKIQIK